MNEPKIIPYIITNFQKRKDSEEESYEDCQVIKEDYCSSPRCGIKSKIVTKSVEKIIFSPVEISTNPYFKYCVTPVKDDRFKYDFSQSETNHTRNPEEIKSKKNVNNIPNNLNTSYLEKNKNELKEEKNESKFEEENEKIKKYKNLVFKKGNEINLNNEDNSDDDANNECKDVKLRSKNKKISLLYNLENNNNVSDNQNAVLIKEQRKYSLNSMSENNKENKKDKKSQKNMPNLLLLNEENYKNKSKVHSLFQSIKLKKDKVRNLKKKNSPFKIFKDNQKNPIVITSQTSNNINRLKKSKRSKEEIQKTKTTNFLKESLIKKNSRDKKLKKFKNKIQNNESDEENIKNIKRENSSNKKNYLSKSKRTPRNQKTQILGENGIITNTNLDNNKNDSLEKNNENESFKNRKRNKLDSYRLKLYENFKKEGTPKTVKRHKTIKPELFNCNDSKKIAFSVRKGRGNSIKKKSNKNIEETKINIEKKESNKKEKEKEKENIKKVKEKKEKKKNKKKEKIRQKEKDKDKDKEEKSEKVRENKSSKKYSVQNLKLILKEPTKESEFPFSPAKRKDKSFTFICKNKNNGFIRESAKKLSSFYSINSQKSNLKNAIRRMNSREITSKNNMQLNLESSRKFHRYSRRNSTKIIHFKNSTEKITAYTNKQTIENINDYTRQCLEIIPDLYELKEIPRCKAKIHPNFKKKKKIALYDLDETIVHCIGEINMNNVENFSRQCDAKIKVLLPGGKEVTVGINIRPHWEEALNIIKDKYHIIAYTASHESYADSVLNFLDPEKKYFEYRLYRCHCVLCNVNEMKFYVKDLGLLDEFCDLKDVVLIDNSVLSFAYHLDNGIPISPFYDSKTDVELMDISNFLLKYANENDIRNKLREIYKLTDYLEIIKNNKSDDSIESSSSISVVEEDAEGEKTNKNAGGGKINTFSLYSNKAQEESKTTEAKNEGETTQKEEYKKSSRTIIKKGNYSQKNLNISITKFLDKNDLENNKKRSKSFCKREKKVRKYDSKRMSDFMNNIRNINKSFGAKKKNKFKSFRYFDINFKKEWDEMKRELSNK